MDRCSEQELLDKITPGGLSRAELFDGIQREKNMY